MVGGVLAYPPSSSWFQSLVQINPPCTRINSLVCISPRPHDRSISSFIPILNVTTRFSAVQARRRTVQCNSSTSPGGPGPGENESRSILDAFFLGKALAEALSERIESAVGELLSTVGRLQAEQQKQVQEFQEEVLERAKRSKEKAAREAVEEQGLIPKSTTVNNGARSSTSPRTNAVTPAVSSSSAADSNGPPSRAYKDRADQDSLPGVPTDG
ncbi:hypothetical protein Nepgr_004369 [Nepenthes gracilis]|uniref:Uncharacterized protein n=1 Tax=Nepenthes gracilis TaxID=150966 RepID=A0AAD3S188_NEPGR|nr:hypothetical protein Nepgr_004369 [Nepenthes gracilis]